MKKSVKWIIGLSATLGACLIIACVIFFSTIRIDNIKDDVLNNKGVIFSKKVVTQLDDTKQESIEGINKIEIDIGSGDVEIKKTEGDKFIATVKGKLIDLSISPKEYKVNLRKVGSTLKFDLGQNWTFLSLGNYFIGDITLEIPASYVDKDLSIDVGSGDVNVSVNNQFKKFNLEVSSGDVDVEMINCAEAEIDVSSGNVKVNNCDIAGRLKLDVSSGRINIKGNFGAFEAEISSGNIDIEAEEIRGDYDIDVSSGSLTLNLPEGSSYKVRGDISSGSIKNNQTGETYRHEFSDTVNGGGEYTIKIEISSGSIIIN